MIEHFERVLADKATPRDERAEALKFLVHLIGDLHQPLHVVERNGDKGGNKRLVFFLERERAVSLHQVWDGLMIRRYVGRSEGKAGPYSDKIDAKTTDELAAEWAKGSVADWANEAHKIAVEHVYADVPADGPPPKIGQAYVDERRAAVELQLRRGGVRLAAVPNRALR
jgi:hypothetical protein